MWLGRSLLRMTSDDIEFANLVTGTMEEQQASMDACCRNSSTELPARRQLAASCSAWSRQEAAFWLPCNLPTTQCENLHHSNPSFADEYVPRTEMPNQHMQ